MGQCVVSAEWLYFPWHSESFVIGNLATVYFNEAITSANQYTRGFNRLTPLTSHLGCKCTLCITIPLSCLSCVPPLSDTDLPSCLSNCIYMRSFFLCSKQEKSCSTLCPEISRWPLSSLTAQLTNTDTNFSSPAVVLLYLTSSSITLALRFSGRALTQRGRNGKPLTAGSTTALGPGHITNTDVFRGVHQKTVPLLKRCFYLLKSPWKLSVGAVSIIHDWCTKVHTWEVHAGL